MLSVVRNQGIDRLRSQASHRRTQEKAEAPMGQPSEAFAERIRQWRDEGRAGLACVIGGPDGLDPRIRQRAELVVLGLIAQVATGGKDGLARPLEA